MSREYGCVDSDRLVGPWIATVDSVWKMPVWTRKGPLGYRSLYGAEVAFISAIGYIAYATDGVGEMTANVNTDVLAVEQTQLIARKHYVDSLLVNLGWIVVDPTPLPVIVKPLSTWQRAFKLFQRQ